MQKYNSPTSQKVTFVTAAKPTTSRAFCQVCFSIYIAIQNIIIQNYLSIFETMRRADREMDAAFALEVFDKAPYITVSFTRPDGTPYGVPLSLARIDEKTFYFHCATTGKKIECIKACPIVALSAVTRCTPTIGPKDGSFTLQYKSAMAVGRAEIVMEQQEKIEGLRAICQRFLPHNMNAFDMAIARSLSRTAVVKITLSESPTGKRKEYDRQGEEMKWGRC